MSKVECVFNDAGGSLFKVLRVYGVYGWKVSPNDLFQGFLPSFLCGVAVPHGDASGEDSLHQPPVGERKGGNDPAQPS